MADTISFKLNGKPARLNVDGDRLLLWVLRTELGLTGPKYGCGQGHCGCCTVLVDKVAYRSCLMPVSSVKGKEVVTAEGLAQDGKLHPQYILQQMNELLKGDAVIVSEVGQNQMWTAQYFGFRKPRTWITSGGLGTMGYGFPAAIGAHFARPDVPVFDVAGDGSIQMNIQELGTVAQYKIPVKIAILNNMYLGMVRQWQELFFDHRYSYTELPSVDFVKIANAYGVEGVRVESVDDVMPALKESLAAEGAFVIDFRIEREDNVFPMVPAGAAINEMIGGHPR